MSSVSAILQQMAENAGRAQLARGQTYGSLVAQASQVPAQIMDDRERQAALDFQRAREAQQMALATRADQRATLDQAYQDQQRAASLEHDRIVRAGLVAAMGPDGDPSQFDAKAAFQAVSRLGRPDALADVIKTHQAMRTAPLFKKEGETGVDPYTFQPIPGLEATPKIPEVGTPGHEIYLRSLANQAGPGAPSASAAPSTVGAPTYAARTDQLRNGPPAPAPALAAPADGPAFDAGGTFTGPTTYGPAPASIAPPALTPPAAAAAARPMTPNEATLKAYADQRKAIEDAKDPHSAAYKEWKDYQAQGGPLGFNEYMTLDANRKKPVVSLSGLNTLYSETDPKAIAAAIMRGEREPDTSGLGRPIGAAVDSELAKQGYNKAAAITDWRATQKHIASMNGAQQLNLNQKINALPDLLDSVDTLASQWHGGRFPILNKANLALAKQGAYGEDVASLARQLDTQIADTTADLATVYMGGNSPTDHGLELAATALKGDWSEKVLHDMVKLGKANVTIRRNSIANTGVAGASATNPYAPAPAPAVVAPPVIPPAAPAGRGAVPGAPIIVIDPAGGSHPFATQAQADAFKRAAGIK
jgi:hypothetical protein